MIDIVDKNNPLTNKESCSKIIKCFPCAVYLLRKTSDFPIIAANEAFYQLIHLDADQIHYKYGGKLSAIFDTTLYQHFNGDNETEATFQHNVCTPNGEQRIFYTQFKSLPQQKDLLLCTSMDVTQYIQTQKCLASVKKQMQFLCNQTQVDLFEWDLVTDSITIYGAKTILSGLESKCTRSELEAYLSELWNNDICKTSISVMLSRIAKGEITISGEMNHQNKFGQSQWTQVCITRQHNAEQPNPTAIGLLENITEEKEISLNYLNETQFYHMLLSEKEAYGQVDITEDRILTVGGIWNLYNEFIGQLSYTHIITEYINKVVHPEDRTHYLELMQCSNFAHSFDNGIQRLGCEFRRILEQNKMVWMELCVHLFRQPITGHLMALIYLSNIDAKKKQSLLLHYKSERDQLTSIYNKDIADTLIRQCLAQSSPEAVHAFLILDLDDFKQINDIYGHQTGDDVLVRFSAILRKTFRRDDIIGRFGGDEFIILMKDVPSEEFIAEKLKTLYACLDEDKNPPLTCSIGVTLAHGGSDYTEIFEQADKALYKVKCEGKARFCFYHLNFTSMQAGEQIEHYSCQHPQLVPHTPKYLSYTKSTLNQFDTFVGEQGDMAYLIDPDSFDLICGNKAFYDRIGLTESECMGMKCYEIVHRRKTPCPFCSKANWSSDKFYLWRDMNESLEQEFLVKDKLVNWLGQEVLLILQIDISNNKSIVDSVDNMASESHLLLSGIQRMEECKTLKDAIISSLESTGHFFRAESVSFWQENDSQQYECAYYWRKSGKAPRYTSTDKDAINIWLWNQNQKWNTPLIIESPEMMLGYSYEMYQYMKVHHIFNQRWLCLQESSKRYGFIVVENCCVHLQNISFLESIAVFIINEMKNRKATESVLYMSCHDYLTDLFNRYSYEEYLQHFDPDKVSTIGVVVANIDNMKGINNTQGSRIGNYYIKRFANLLKEIFSPQQVYRLNGDEFLVIAEDITHADLINRLKKLNTELAKREDYTVSIGHNWDDVEKDLSDLIAIATTDMHISKKKRYDSGIIRNNMEHGNMLHTLMTEIKEGRFEIYLQPKVDLATQQLIGAEALIRQHGEDNRIIPPCEFIPILEDNNLIRYIDLFVFQEVCTLLEKWQRMNQNFIVSLNFSRLTLLEEDILFNIEQILSCYQISRNNIEIEITENFLATGKSTLYQVIQDLYQAGCYLSLDDFGIRYANLSMLADINFHTLKLDKSLIKSISNRNANQVILKHIIHLCKDLSINVIAEGVETEIQQNILIELGCTQGQGYLFGKPMPVSEFERTYGDLFQSTPDNKN